MKSNIIVMLTHNDKTVQNALNVFESCKDLPVEYWGFKDIGLPKGEMKELIGAMKAAGKQTFLEVVTYTEDECMAGAKLAIELGFDCLCGTVYYQHVLEYLRTQPIKYMPFCGKVSGSPSVLEGDIQAIVDDGKRLLSMGVFGIDLLAFRHKEGAALAKACCEQISAPVVIAGSIGSFERIDFIDGIDPWAFTMGSALFTKNFVPDGDFRTNLEAVIAYMDSIGSDAINAETIDMVTVRGKNSVDIWMEDAELCRQYYKTDKITFGLSELPAGGVGALDVGHSEAHEVFYCVSGEVLCYVPEEKRYHRLASGDAMLVPPNKGHKLYNIGETKAVLTWSCAPRQ